MALGSAGDKLLITSDAYLHIVGDTEVYLAIRGVCFFLLRLGVATFVGLDNISLTERLKALMKEICNKFHATGKRVAEDFHFI